MGIFVNIIKIPVNYPILLPFACMQNCAELGFSSFFWDCRNGNTLKSQEGASKQWFNLWFLGVFYRVTRPLSASVWERQENHPRRRQNDEIVILYLLLFRPCFRAFHIRTKMHSSYYFSSDASKIHKSCPPCGFTEISGKFERWCCGTTVEAVIFGKNVILISTL